MDAYGVSLNSSNNENNYFLLWSLHYLVGHWNAVIWNYPLTDRNRFQV